jgi:hypothetical protein
MLQGKMTNQTHANKMSLMTRPHILKDEKGMDWTYTLIQTVPFIDFVFVTFAALNKVEG